MTSKHFAVVGDPIDHSLSPAIHTAAYRFLGLDWDYTRHQVPEGTLEDFVEGDGKELSGISVTMPLKLEAAKLASSVDSIVKLLGVANTLVRVSDGFAAYNTDVFGIEMALRYGLGPEIKNVSILGAGATAQSALFAVSRKAPQASVVVYVRDLAKSVAIKELASQLSVELMLKELSEYGDAQDLTISTVPAAALDALSPKSQNGWLLNVNYSSKDTQFSKAFESEKVVQGETMLIWQAIAQIRIFLNGSSDLELKDEAALYANMFDAI